MKLPRYSRHLHAPRRYKVLHGGRGGAKSQTVGRILLLKGAEKKIRVLCAREFQNSIRESVHKLLASVIEDNEALNKHYTTTENSIRGANGTEFIFKGVRHNVDSIKSMTGITDLWIEEGHTISQKSWDILIPTIREPGSEIWVTYNPTNEDDPVHQMFVINTPPRNSIVLNVNWRHNPWFSDELKAEKDHLFRVNPEKAIHVWEGETLQISDAQIFKGKFKSHYLTPTKADPCWLGPYFGSDWGFSVDPTTLVKLWVYDGNLNIKNPVNKKILYIQAEAYKVGVQLNHIPKLFETVSGSKEQKIYADNSRPETIEHIKHFGFTIEGAPKWPGSVEDGVEYLKSFDEIIVSPDCPETLKEFKKYSYKEDKITGKITNVIVDAWNHCIDAIRYGLSPFIQKSKNTVGSWTRLNQSSTIKKTTRINKKTEAW